MNLVVIILSSLIIYLLSSFVVSKIFAKAKIKKVYAYIPIFNFIKLLSLTNLKWYYIFGFIISPINIWLWIYLNIKLGKKFNKSNSFIFGMIILPIIFYIILAFNKDDFNKNDEYDKKGFKLTTVLVSVLTITLICSISIPFIFNSITKGLDLAGGFEILYQVSSAEEGKKLTKDDLESAYKTMMRRIDKLGVSEPEISIEGNDKIRVKLAGVTDPDTARDYITITGELTFRDSSDNKLMDKDVISGAKISQDQNGNPAILLNVKDKDKFYEVTSSISQTNDKLIVIWLDFDKSMGDSYKTADCGNFEDENTVKCLSAATVSEGFSSNVIIQGNFTYDQAKSLVDLINSGSSNVKYKEISSKTVTAAFGENSLNKTAIAGVIGILLIIVFMISCYKFSGFISSLSVLVYTCFVLLIFYLIDGVLTLTGIAALILGIGMAVDACVITNERIKEELKKGRSLKTAFINGNKNSFSSIFDSNVTTLIIALILFAFGESSVKGFATMLIINILMTMFIIIMINRYIMKLFVNTEYFDNKTKTFVNYFENKKEKVTKFNFVNNFKKHFILPIICFVLAIIVTIITGINLGVDFKGGSDITIVPKSNIEEKVIKKDIEKLGYTVSDVTITSDNTLYVKVNEVLEENEIKDTKNHIEEKYDAKTEIAVVSNVVKRDLIKNALIALLIAFLGISVYISIRYKFSYAISAILALLHDVIMMICLFSIFNVEINTMFIAAILTIVGYSINNTIVIFDRIRENISHSTKRTKEEYEKKVDESIKQTLFRTINTTITTMLPIIMLLFFGAREIFEFDIAILFGLVAGTYSSVFLSSQIWLRIELKDKKNGKTENKKVKKAPDELLIKGINS
ncbi:MAG: protein translocase subunit SecD [Bacilli bacterium]|nr:protein translocase subunit SecD [Bacilli bacterium]